MIKYLISLIIFLISSAYGIGQTHNYYDAPRVDRKYDFKSTVRNIQDNGVLVVRLLSNNPKIEFLKSKGKHKRAKSVEEDYEYFNKHLIISLEAYSYSKILYTYGYLVKEYQDGLNDGRIYLDEDLIIDPSISIDEKEEILYLQPISDRNKLRLYYEDFTLVETPFEWSLLFSDQVNTKRTVLFGGLGVFGGFKTFFNLFIKSVKLGRMIDNGFRKVSLQY